MKKLSVILIYNTVVRGPLTELGNRPDTEYWLVASPLYVSKLSAAHRAPFRKVIQPEDFDADALASTLAPHLGAHDAAATTFITNDESCELACAALQERFALPRWPAEQLRPFVNKMASKAALADTGLRVPKHLLFDRRRAAVDGERYRNWIASEIGFPMVVKPIDKYASMGVHRLDDPAALRTWMLWAGLHGTTETYEVDEFIDGTLYNCDSLVADGQIIWSTVCRNVNPCLDFAAGRTIGVHTMPDDDPIAAAVHEFSQRVLAVLAPPDGAVHMEIFRTGTGELYFLEVAARPPGGDMRAVYLNCQGFDIDVTHFLLRSGAPDLPQIVQTGRHGGWFIHPKRRGRVVAIDVPRLVSEHHLDLRVSVGELIEASSQHIVDPPSAQVMVYNDDLNALTRDADLLASATFYRTEN